MKKSSRYGKRLLAGILCAAMLFTNNAARGISAQAADVNPAGNETPTTEISDAETGPKDEAESEEEDEPTKSEETSGETGDTSDESAGDQESSDKETDKSETENPGGGDQSGDMGDAEGEDDRGEDADHGENSSEDDAAEKSPSEEEITDEKSNVEGEEISEQPTEKSSNEDEAELDELLSVSAEERLALMSAEGDIASGTSNDIAWVIDKNGKLTVTGTGDWIHSNGVPWSRWNDKIISAKVNVTGMTNASGMFQYCWALKKVDVSGFDTSTVIDMSSMFFNCLDLNAIDVSGFHTQNVTNMSYMFRRCNSLDYLNVSNFITGKVTDMSCMFEDCNSLTSLDVSRFNTSQVTDMGGMFLGCNSLSYLNIYNFDTSLVTDMSCMFAGCSSLTDINLSRFNTSKVTSMRSMFENCAALKTLDVSSFDTAQVTDMSGMFMDCAALTKLDVSSFNTENVDNMGSDLYIIMNEAEKNTEVDDVEDESENRSLQDDVVYTGMFSGCSHLTELDLSNFDTSKVTSMLHFFYDCGNLVTIYTPYNLKQSVSLPAASNDTWYRSDGSTVTKLPQNLSNSVILGKNYIPEEKSTIADMKITKNKLTVAVHDENTKKGIAGANVTVNGVSYITDEDGVALLEASVEKVRTNITVTAEGYENSITSGEAANGMLIHIFMIPQSSNLRITQAIANMNGSNYDLLREKLILGYYQDINEISNKQNDSFILTVKTNYNAKLYELLSKDGTVIIQNTSGTFTIPVATGGTITGGGTIQAKMPIQSTLKQGKYQLRVTDDSGHAETVGIGLTSTVSYKLKERQKIAGKASIGSSMEVPIPENVPLIGGGTFAFGLEDELPIDISIDDDGKLKVAFNKPADQDFNQYKENYNHLAKKATTASQLARQVGDVKGFGAGYFDIGGSICGYGEGNISELDEGTITVKVGVIATLEGTGGYKHYFMAGVVPINLFLEGEASVGAGMNASVSMKNWKITGFDFTGGSMTGKIGVTVGGGIGIGIELNASGNGSVNYVWKPAKKYQKAWFEGSFKAEAVLLFYHKTLWESDKYSYTIMEKGSDERSFQGSSSNGVQETDFVPLSRSYLEYSQGYLNIMSNSIDSANIDAHSSNDKTVVKAAVYPSAAPIMTQVGNTRYLFWVEDIASRSDNNIGAIVYAESEDGVTWSEPKRLLPETEDGTFDGSFNIFTSGSKIYITWQDGASLLEDDASMEQVLKSMVIRRAVFDTESETISVTNRLTEKSGYYMYPCTAVQGTSCYTAYVHNSLDSGDIYGNNTQNLYCIKDESETPTSLPLPVNNAVINMTAGIFDGKASIVGEIDTDGNLATSEDREIYLWDMTKGNSTRLTDNAVPDSMPVISQNGKIYWYQDGNILRLRNRSEKEQGIWAKQALTAPVCFAVATNQDNRDMILWEMADSDKPDGAVAVYGCRETSEGTWESPSKCAESQGTITSRVSASGDWDHLKIAHLEGSFLEDGTILKDLCVLSRKDMTDISLDSVEFDTAQVHSGTPLPLQAFVTNCGNTVIDSVQFSVDGLVIQDISSLNLQPGESRNITMDGFTVPADLNGKREFTVTAAAQGDWKETNNTQSITLETTKYKIDTFTRLDSGGTWLDFTVWNEGNQPASGIAKVHKSTKSGDVIFETEFSVLPSESGYSCSVDLSGYEDTVTHYYVEALPDYAKEETDGLNEFVYIGYGTGVEESLEADTDLPVSSIALNDTEIFLKAGDHKKLDVVTDTGIILSSSEVLWGSYNTSIANVDRDGTVTAHRNGDTYVTVAYGDLQCECIVHVGETNQKTYSVTFDTQGGDPIKKITGLKPGDVVTLPENANMDDKIFLGWYTQASGGEKIEDSTIVIQKSIILYAHWGDAETRDGLWVRIVPDQIYTGKPIKPAVRVYDSNRLLELNKDYTITYKNNIKANDASNAKTAPTITVTGKGNYSGKETVTFKIIPITLTEANTTVSDMTKVYNKKIQKPIPSITVNGRSLRNKTDFTVSYPDDTQGAYQAVGTYRIVVTGKGNYTGEQTLTFAITDKTPISKVTVAKIPNQAYSGDKITPAPVVKYKKSTLAEHVDYELEYRDNTEIGKAALILRGKGDYVGSKTVSFQITGGSLKKAMVTGLISPVVYTGAEIRQNAILTIKVNGTDVTLQNGKDYTVSYQNNVKAGTAKVIYKGINGYTGTLQKSYKIIPYNILSDDGEYIKYTKDMVCPYLKGGCRPKPDIYFKDTLLKKGVDYTLSYKNNNAVNGEKTPIIIVKGKGNFTDRFEIPFTITQQKLSNMTLAPCDKVYKRKANIYQITPKLLDTNGKALNAGKDFNKKSITYTYGNDVTLENGITKKAGDSVENTDIIPANTQICVSLACGTGNLYEGTFTGTYRIVAADIKSAKVTIPAQIYTGSEITPDKTQITVKVSKMELSANDYDIVSYSNNVKKGTASVTIAGKGNYGGTKTVNFTIRAKGFLWWWR